MTPLGRNVRINKFPIITDEADAIFISVAFSCDIPVAEELAEHWKFVSPTFVDGPAYKNKGGNFTPGEYVAMGNVITHRGCPNRCWFCDAWKSEGNIIRELPITDGWNLLDNNILACSKNHQENVYKMLLGQSHRTRLSGGLEAKRFTKWNAEWLQKLNPESAYFAYDEPDDYEPLVEASKILNEFNLFKSHSMGCYVLIGYKKDTFLDAERRLKDVMRLGFMPQAMLLNRGEDREEFERKKWKRFQREWANKVIVGSKMPK